MITPLGFDQQRTPLSTEDRARARRFGQMIREADRAVCTIIARIRQPLLATAQRSVRPRPELLVDTVRAWWGVVGNLPSRPGQ